MRENVYLFLRAGRSEILCNLKLNAYKVHLCISLRSECFLIYVLQKEPVCPSVFCLNKIYRSN